MSFNSSDYFAYKKNKMQSELVNKKLPISKLSFILQLFIATFIFIFVAIVFVIMRYSSKMDIEYQKGDLSFRNGNETQVVTPSYVSEFEDEQRTIDKRLMLIQQEENAPSEARIIANKKANDEVMSSLHVEQNKKIDKIEKFKTKNIQSEINNLKEEVKKKDKKEKIKEKIREKRQDLEKQDYEDNVVISSKVLVGRFSSFNEASDYQEVVKTNFPKTSAYVRKVGDVYTVQLGSYQDFYVAKHQAQKWKAKGLDVWIYQQ